MPLDFSGTTVALRALDADDAQALAAHVDTLSPKDLRARFMGPLSRRRAKAWFARTLVDAEGPHAAAIGAFDPQGRLLGFAEAHDDIDKASWDAAFTVVPEARGRGIGSALAREVAAAARAKGARRVIAVTESDNRAMIKVGEKTGRRVKSRGVGVEMEIGVDPPPDLGSAPFGEQRTRQAVPENILPIE